jgi:predicted O-methyltransferase YrrM
VAAAKGQNHRVSTASWSDVDSYFTGLLGADDDTLTRTLAASDAAGLPNIPVSALQGKFLHLLARAVGARSILEIGTLGGYSATWLGRALPPDGRLLTLELDPRHAEVARANLAAAGLADRVEVVVGPALDTLARLAADGAGPYDLVFIDADKTGYPDYLTATLRLVRPGSLIVADNVVRQGKVADPASTDPNVQGVRKFAEMLSAESTLDATVLQTVGAKGHDGLAIALVTG